METVDIILLVVLCCVLALVVGVYDVQMGTGNAVDRFPRAAQEHRSEGAPFFRLRRR